MMTHQDSRLSDRVRRLLGSLKKCSDAVRDEQTCSRACRGQVRPAGEAPEEAVSELEEMSCTLAGQKPITLLHCFFPEAQSLAHLCNAGILQQAGGHAPPVRSGPTLIFVHDPPSRARALAAGGLPFRLCLACDAIVVWTSGVKYADPAASTQEKLCGPLERGVQFPATIPQDEEGGREEGAEGCKKFEINVM